MMSSINLDHVSRKEIQCECGNVIKYEDMQSNCDFPAYSVLRCSVCGYSHRTIVDGKLENISGAM